MIAIRLPDGRTLTRPLIPGGTALDALRAAGLPVYAPCGGRGICGRCRITCGGEERLACRTPLSDGMEIQYHPAGEGMRILLDGNLPPLAPDPAVQKRAVTPPRPSLSDQRSDERRLSDELGGLFLPLDCLRALPGAETVTAVLQDGAPAGIEPGDTTESLLGMAVDIGTTTLAGYLFDLRGGRMLASVSAPNPQAVHGADVLSRVAFAVKEGGAPALREEIVLALGDLAASACARSGRLPSEIYRLTVAGNTIMLHFLLRLETRGLAASPFPPVSVRSHLFPARELGLSLGAGAYVHTLPCVAAYVGADTVAAVLSAGMDEGEGTALLIDFGTNGEIVLRHGGLLYACSAAAGPAFEGGHISHGLPGVDSAIDHFSLDGGPHTIGGLPPAGLCGTGLVDVAAELLRGGLMDETGRLAEGDAFRVAPGVLLTQADVRALQSAKAAVAAGVRVLLHTAGVTAGQLDALYLAGGFGSYMDGPNAAGIGLIPALPESRVRAIGNAAGSGASAVLLSQDMGRRAEGLAMRYIELSSSRLFNDYFTDSMFFKPFET